MIILGIDPGIADTGFGVVEKQGDNYTEIDHGSISTLKSDSLAKRLQELYRELTKLIKKHNPERVAIEQLFFAKNVKTAITVAHARGVVLLAAQTAKCEIAEFTPLQIKQALTGYGAADKRQMQEMTKITLKLKTIPKPDDAADALAIAICCGQTKQYA
ncbi:crossover junction endodeoxyribonuclease RuvC [bacterium]|jgi:crossover junction endodeoxyribonuclease RuvC|nr:crossover junction endodeoxyribonuclease RuvC [bacterium]MDP6571517.1 crossover junction endodeoxyribonuclease RuvC [Patescibacteria group bacterium]|tara:strand:+ start:1392 stop:1868 length:477 start_codon:yes stop_codon:yes gene_type:complete